MKLYKVKLRGKGAYLSGQVDYSMFYVIADNTTRAYEMAKEYMDTNDLGFSHERELQTIELVAEAVKYPDCQHILLIDIPSWPQQP